MKTENDTNIGELIEDISDGEIDVTTMKSPIKKHTLQDKTNHIIEEVKAMEKRGEKLSEGALAFKNGNREERRKMAKRLKGR